MSELKLHKKRLQLHVQFDNHFWRIVGPAEIAALPAAPRNDKAKEPRGDRKKAVRLLHRDLTTLAIGV